MALRLYQEMPRFPQRIVEMNGALVVGEGDIEQCQDVWRLGYGGRILMGAGPLDRSGLDDALAAWRSGTRNE